MEQIWKARGKGNRFGLETNGCPHKTFTDLERSCWLRGMNGSGSVVGLSKFSVWEWLCGCIPRLGVTVTAEGMTCGFSVVSSALQCACTKRVIPHTHPVHQKCVFSKLTLLPLPAEAQGTPPPRCWILSWWPRQEPELVGKAEGDCAYGCCHSWGQG